MTVAEAQRLCLERNIPFFSYRLPGEKKVHFGAQRSPVVHLFRGLKQMAGRRGFVLVPFWAGKSCPSVVVYPEIYFTDVTAEEGVITSLEGIAGAPGSVGREGRDSTYEEYCRQIGIMIDALRKGELAKVVMARSLTVTMERYGQAVDWFGGLTERYPRAFVFLVSVPGVTVWAGASPEIFMQQTESGFKTMALAGTQALKGEPAALRWESKEREEQQIVSDYLCEALKEAGESSFRMTGPFSMPAGNVAHLCTLFEKEEPLPAERADRLREILHPTPAVGGFPKEKALRLIEETEICDRRYYAGYLGPMEEDGTFQFYVNLRCMELFPTAARLYVGGGITALSDPDKEWKETELKSKTLLNWGKDGTIGGSI